MSELPKVPPRTREDLIASELSDEDIIILIHHLKARVEKYGDVQAARLLIEFKYGKNPDPPSQTTSLEDLMLAGPLAPSGLGSE